MINALGKFELTEPGLIINHQSLLISHIEAPVTKKLAIAPHVRYNSAIMKSTLLALSVAFSLTALAQQTPATAILNLTAKSANVTESGVPVRINLLRWSTDEERSALIDAM